MYFEARSVFLRRRLAFVFTGVLDGLSDVSGLDTSSTEVEEVETRSDASSSNKPKLIAPNAFTTPVPQTSQTPPEAASITSSITSVTSMNNSFGSVNIDELLGKSASSQISESTCTFRTCEDETQQEAPSKGAESFSLWTGQGSPIVHPLPESPDPAKVPFPAFKSGGRGDDKELKSERFSAITHSTPKRRHSREDEQEEDSEKTPTAENEPLPKGREVTEEVEIESATDIQRNITNIKEVERSEPPLASEIGAGTSKEIVPSGLEPADNEPLRDSVRIEATSVDLEQSVPEQGQNLPLSETPKRTDEPLPLKNKMRSK